MKNVISIFLLLIPIFSYSQKKAGTGNTSSITSVTPVTSQGPSQSGASEIEQGYHYHLPAYTFFNYTHTSITNDTTKINSEPVNVVLLTVVKTIRPRIDTSDFFFSWNNDSSKCFDLECLKTVSDTIMQCVSYDETKYKISDCKKPIYISQITTTIVIDTVERYCNKRLRISVTQADSGKLAISFYEPSNQEKEEPTGIVTEIGPIEFDSLYIKYFNGYRHIGHLMGQEDYIDSFTLKVNPKIKFNDKTYFIRLHYWAWQLGALTIPFKYYFGGKKYINTSNQLDTVPNNVTTSINVALAGGFRFGGTKFYYDQTKTHNTLAGMITAFIGPTTISATSTNTFHSASKSTTELAISAGFGVMLELKNINFGAFWGWDLPVSAAGQDWFYANKPWLGFGIGLNLALFTLGNHQAL
jgi:hypothetical protein